MPTVQQDLHKAGEKHLSKISANNYCNLHFKTEYLFLKEVDKFALTNSIYHLLDGYKRFFNHQGKFPKYKSRHKSKKSYTTNFTNNNISIGSSFVKLPKLGRVKAVIHRLPEDNWITKSATVTQNRDGTYQVSVLFEYKDLPVIQQLANEDNTLGLDYKSDGLYADSNGNVCNMPHYYRKSAEILAKRQRKLKHKVIGSNNYRKQQTKTARVSRHTANQRKDFLHKTSTAIAKQYACICVEDLNMRAMSNKGFGNGKATLDNGYGMLLHMLEYKLKANGGYLIKVDRFYPSSRICHCCGTVHPEMKDLSIRKMQCDCGYTADRDYNAALNIKREGLRLLTA